MRALSILLVLSAVALAACGADPSSGADAAVTQLPDGAPCAAGEIYCGGTVCIVPNYRNSCGACNRVCLSPTPTCQSSGASYVCVR